jgi:hypothetical protein
MMWILISEHCGKSEPRRFLPHPLSPLLHEMERGTGGEVIKLFLWLLRTLLIFTFSLFFANFCLAQIAEDSNLTTNVATYLVGNGTSGPYQLKDYFILEGTERIEKSGLLLNRDHDYFLDFNHGLITFSLPLSPGDTLQITYKKLNLNLRRKYFHRELVYLGNHSRSAEFSLSGGKSITGLKNRSWSFFPKKGSSDLVLSGSKTFSLEVGSLQDLSLKQSLWLSAKGKATQNLEISLQVSDQNMPATPEGTTKRLEELDKVQILVKSPNFSGTLGDYYLSAGGGSAYGRKPSGSELFFYEKKLKGIMAEATAGKNTASFALASSRGEYFTNKFFGEENKQGPYQLRGKNGEGNIMILPGTERVWVDGEKIQRGSNNDYTIDYNRGTIQFTPRRLITSDSRITVDFEYSVKNYKRDFYSGNLAANFLNGKAELKASGIFEKDDRSHPSSFTLSSEDKYILSQAGNERLLASKDGATFVGKGEGDYELAYDSSKNPYYQYAGSDSGSYKVSFSWVGEKKGSYQYKGGGAYQYVYPGNGDFLPLMLLPLPESHSLFDLSLSFFPIDALKTQIEWAKSKKDKNTFSEMGDEHIWGDAVSLKSVYQNTDFHFLKSNFHRLELEGEYRLLKKDFAPFGRVDIVEKERRWGLPKGSISADEKTYQFSGLISPSEFFLLDFDYGKLKTEGNFTSQRRSLGAEISPVSWISAKGKSEKIKSQNITPESLKEDGEWTRNLVVLNNKLKKLSTTLSWEQERRSSSLSGSTEQKDNFNQLSGKVSLGLSNVIKTCTQLSYREDDGFSEGELDKSFSYTWRNQLSVRNLKGMFSSDLEFTRRIKKYQQDPWDRHPSGKDSRQDLLISRIDFYPPSQLLNLKFYHSQNQIHSAQRMDTYLEVEEGRGDYIFEDGEYVPHPEGNFIRLSEWVGDTRPSLDLNKSVRLIFSPHKVSSRGKGKSFWSEVGKIFSTDSFINLQGRFLDKKTLGFYFLYPLIQLSDESILSQKITIRHDLYLLPASRPLNFRFRWEKTEDKDNLLSGEERQERGLKQELLLKSYISSKHFFESRIGKEKIKNVWGNEPKNLIKDKSLTFGFTRRQAQPLELKLSTEYKNKEEQIQNISAEFFSISPELLWSLLSQGRLKAQFQWTHLHSLPPEQSLPYVLSEGKRRGENYNWRFFFDYRLNQYLTSSMIYSGESVPDKKAKHTARMELKAFF